MHRDGRYIRTVVSLEEVSSNQSPGLLALNLTPSLLCELFNYC